MGKIASTVRNFKYVHTPKDGVSLNIMPPNVVFVQGGGQQTAVVRVEALEGTTKLPCSSDGLQVSIFTTPFAALSFSAVADGDHYNVTFTFRGADADTLNQDIILNCTVKGIASTQTVHVTTVKNGDPGKDGDPGAPGKDGENGVSFVVSPEAIVHKEGVRSIYYVYAGIYDGGEQKVPTGLGSLGTSEGGNLADGIRWWWYTADDGRRGYRIECAATASLSSTLLTLFTATYNDKTFKGSFSITTVKNGTDGTDGTNGTDGVDGARGPYIPPAMLWKDYPTNPIYYFESADPTPDPPETKLDVVLVENGDGSLTPFECIQSHFKDSNKEPGTAGGVNYWRVFNTNRFKAIATDLLLADKARIEFLSGQAVRVGDNKGIWGYFGAPYRSNGEANAGEIIFTGQSAEYQKKVEEGQSVEYTPQYSTFSLNNIGFAKWGAKMGKRIEVDPDLVNVRIYDDNGELRTTLSGEWKTPDEWKPGNGADANIVGGSMIDISSVKVGWTDPVVSGTHVILPASDSNKAECDGYALIKIPKIRMQAVCGSVISSGSASGPVQMPNTSVNMTVRIYTGKVKDMIQSTAPKLQRHYRISSTQENHTETQTNAREDVTVPIKKDEYIRIEARIEAEITNNTGGSWSILSQDTGSEGDADYKGRWFSGQFVYKMRQSVIAANGLFISYDSLNFFYVAFDAQNKLHVLCVASGTKIFGNDNWPA